jgi:hypothetical protein
MEGRGFKCWYARGNKQIGAKMCAFMSEKGYCGSLVFPFSQKSVVHQCGIGSPSPITTVLQIMKESTVSCCNIKSAPVGTTVYLFLYPSKAAKSGIAFDDSKDEKNTGFDKDFPSSKISFKFE